jgi:hypothetical protein
MKTVAAGFTTALLVFAVASAMSEMLWTSEVTPPGDNSAQRKANRPRGGHESVRATRGESKSSRTDETAHESPETQAAEFQRTLSEIRQRESEVQARQEALRFVYEQMNEERQSVDLVRRRVSDEVAVLREAAVRVAQRHAMVPAEGISTAALSRSVDPPANAKPVLRMRDGQAVRDTAVLVHRLAQQVGLRAATGLLRSLRERDAAKVLSEISATDSPMALRLSQDLLIARDESATRR